MARHESSQVWTRPWWAFGLGLLPALWAAPLSAEEVDDGDLAEEALADGELDEPADTAETQRGESQRGEAQRGETGRAESSAAGTGHGGQFSLRLGVVGGYRMMFRYAESPFCGPPGATEDESCFYGAPWNMDVALGFAPFDSLEVFGWGRFGVARDAETDTDALRAFGAGVRIYTMSDSALKFFVQPAVAMSFEGGGQDPQWRSRGSTRPAYGSDLLFHFSVGPQYDFNRYFGAYAGLGMTVGARRAMSATLEGTFGLQARYP